MPPARFTRKWIATVTTTKRTIYFDDAADPPGFGLRVDPSGTKRWLLNFRIGSGRSARKGHWTIGASPTITLDSAREKARWAYEQARMGIDPRHVIQRRVTALTLAEFAKLFLATHSATLKPRTQADHEQLLRLHILPVMGSTKVAQLSPHEVMAWQAGMPRARQTGKALALLHEMMELAESPLPPWNAIRSPRSNPAHKIPVIKGRRSDDRFDDDELAAIWAAITRCELEREISIWAAGCIRCIMLTGARFREMAGDRRYYDQGAHWDRLDVRRMRLTIVDHKGSRGRGPKTLELPQEAVVEMQRMPRVGPYIFANSRSPMYPIGAGANKAMERVLRRAGLDHGGLHAFRRTVADVAEQAGVSLEYLAAQLGHARVSTTEGYQSRIKARQARAAVQMFAAEMLRRVRA